MDLPGIEIRPLRNMVGGFGDAGFCEVFFTDVHRARREPHRIAQRRLGHGQGDARQRTGLAVDAKGLQWGYGPTVRDLVDLARDAAASTTVDPAAARRRLHRGRDPAVPPAAADLGRGEQEAGARRVAAQGAQGPARQGRVRPGQGHDGRAGMLAVEQRPGVGAVGPTASCSAPRSPSGGGTVRGAAQHHRRTHPRPPPRHRRRGRTHLDRRAGQARAPT